MECKHKRMCEVLVGLGDVDILEVGEPLDGALVAEVRTVGVPVRCARAAGAGCGRKARGW